MLGDIIYSQAGNMFYLEKNVKKYFRKLLVKIVFTKIHLMEK